MIPSSAHFPSLFPELLGFPQELLSVTKVTKIPDLVWDCLAVLQALHPSGELGTPGCITAKGWQLKTIRVLKLLEIFFKVRSSKSSTPHLGSASVFQVFPIQLSVAISHGWAKTLALQAFRKKSSCSAGWKLLFLLILNHKYDFHLKREHFI